MSQDRPSLQAGAASAAAPAEAREKALAVYLAVGLMLLVPGLLASAGIGVERGPLSGWLGPLDRSLQHIAFASGLRFWLGVAGATMMGLLVFYPLRKAFGIGQWISVAAWFHIHMVLGLLGPILILYHCYFGTGSTPANVALFTTMTVTLSGLFGHYVHARLSAAFYGQRRSTQSHLLEALDELGRLDASASRSRLVEDLQAFESQSEHERRGLIARFFPGRPLRERQHDILSRAVWLIDSQANDQGWSPARRAETKARLVGPIARHFAGLDRAARRGVYERLLGLWRLLHLPLFCITLIAIGVHVWKVWGIDRPTRPETATGITASPKAPAADTLPPAAQKLPGKSEPRLLQPPRPASRPAPSPTPGEWPDELGDGPPAATSPSITAPRQPAPAQGPAEAPSDPTDDLARRAAGPLDPATILARLAGLRADPAFDHGRTRFPLTGRHQQAACEACHATTLEATPRQCIDCHRKDDVHRGRRPTCESCHQPTSWGALKDN